ncbi:MAG TPA: ATP-binding protein [Kofleriaceae bacterium]
MIAAVSTRMPGADGPEPFAFRVVVAQALVMLAGALAEDAPEIKLLEKNYPGTITWQDALANRGRPATEHDTQLLALGACARLSAIELLSIALLAAVEEDPLFGRAVARMQAPAASPRPSVGLLAALCAPLAGLPIDALHEIAGGNARATGVISLGEPTAVLAEQPVALSPAIYLAICARDAVVPGLAVGERADVLPPSIAAECARLAGALGSPDRALVLRAASTADGRAATMAVAAATGRRAAFLDGPPIPGLGPYLTLRGLVPVYTVELAPGERKRLSAPLGYDGPVIVLAGREGTIELDGAAVPSWQVPVPPAAERQALWRRELHDDSAAALADSLGAQYRHGASRIAQLGRSARRLAALDKAPVGAPHVRSASWLSEGQGLGGLAEPIHDEIPDNAMVTTPLLQRDLELLLSRCRVREGLGSELGTAIRARLRPGVRAMFVGPSGTGKTLAASWLATKLSLPLYRVDLASVTSKYIGETEKNLAQLLSRAEHEEVVLLFDEADSMFGKRTDVKEANDRFANAQTNFLLQRIEAFDGIVLLTSNSRSRLDPAFTRRLDSVIEFPLPGPEERRALWFAHLGDAHALDATDINRLSAVVDLVGGHIRNAVLSAAVLARRADRRICFRDLAIGLSIEYRKLGRSIPADLQKEAQ